MKNILNQTTPPATKLEEFQGSLWRGDTILRPMFKGHCHDINSTAKLKASIRAGKHTWPGCYEVSFATSDGQVMCYECVVENVKLILGAIRDNDTTGGWQVISCGLFNEDVDQFCANCNRQIGL